MQTEVGVASRNARRAIFGTPNKGFCVAKDVWAHPCNVDASQKAKKMRELAKTKKKGRPQSIPEEHWATVFMLYSQGKGYRRIADLLIPLGVSCTKSSVERLIKGLPPYQGRRVAAGG